MHLKTNQSCCACIASPMNASTSSGAEFAYGSGHINPLKAVDPGLVYEAHKEDYINFLCSIIGYTEEKVRLISGDNSTCPKGVKKGLTKDLNYPSMTAAVAAGESFRVRFQRTVTNFGIANSTYKAKVFTSSKLRIKVVPEVLTFTVLNEKKSFGRDDFCITGVV